MYNGSQPAVALRFAARLSGLEARAELSRIRHQTAEGTYVQASEITVSQYLDEYFVGATRGRRESTRVWRTLSQAAIHYRAPTSCIYPTTT